MVEKKLKRNLRKKQKTRQTRQSTSINITIDNRKSTAPRKAKEASKLKPGTQNVPLVNYFPQFQPARSVITEQKPNNGFSSADFERVTSQYQTQFKEYLDGKLDDQENRMLEELAKDEKRKILSDPNLKSNQVQYINSPTMMVTTYIMNQ